MLPGDPVSACQRAYDGASSISICDLHYWERVLIGMLRMWNGKGPTRAIAEHSIALRMHGEPIYPLLDGLFGLFAHLSRLENVKMEYVQERLSKIELLLLDLASGHFTAMHDAHLAVENSALHNASISLASKLGQAGIFIREICQVAPGEEERLEQAIARSYQTMFRME